MATAVFMPKLSMTMEQGTVLQWFKQEGDDVKEGDLLLEVMTDKINIEVEAYASGKLLKIYYGPDSVVPVNAVIGYIGEAGEEVPDTPPAVDGAADREADGAAAEETAQAQPAQAADPASAGEAVPASGEAGKVRATPAARKAAREHGVALEQVKGSGPNGRIHRADVEAYVQANRTQATPLARKVAAAEGIALADVQGTGVHGKVHKADVLAAKHSPAQPAAAPVWAGEKVKLEGMRKVIAQRMAQSAFTAPHVTLVTEVDMSEAIRLRTALLPEIEQTTGERLSYTEIIMKAVARALMLHPQVNTSLEGEYLVRHAHANIGLAVAVPNGLLVPVIRETERKGLAALTAACKQVARLAREGKLTPDDMSGGTFTISNLGMYAIDAFTPIINPPESAILGVGRIQEKPVGVAGRIELKPMMTLSLSFDHRVIDGAPAAAFLQDVKEALEQPYRMLV